MRARRTRVATFRPAALESLSHFPVTVAAHLAGDRLTVLVENLDGALGPISPDSLGQRLLDIVERLINHWDNPIRDVSVLSAPELQNLDSGGQALPQEVARQTGGVPIVRELPGRALHQ